MLRFLPKTPIGLFAVFVLWPTLACVFVAMIVFCFLQTILDPIKAALGDGTYEPAPQQPDVVSGMLLSIGVSALLLGVVVSIGYFVYHVMKSNRAIKTCQRNGTVILSPDYSFPWSRYLWSKVKVDLSRTNFANYLSSEFPLSKIHRLKEVRIAETTVPDFLAQELLSCKSLTKLNLTGSAVSNEAVEMLTLLQNVEFVLEGCTSQSAEWATPVEPNA